MISLIPQKLKNLAQKCPFPLYVVGGTCRDFLAGLKCVSPDYDISAPAGAEEFSLIAQDCGFKISAIYKNTGTVKLCADGNVYEFTSFRSDEYARGGHTPVKTFFTYDVKKDALRRDFKCNAVYYDIKAEEFCDPLGGIADIKNRAINTVRQPERVFGEDGLRLMRLARQSATTGFKPTAECMRGAQKNCELIADISVERIWAELDAILHADKKYGRQYAQYDGLCILRDSGVLKQILPELALGEGMKQRSDYHGYDVLEHSFRCVKYADDEVRLAALLHDVGKPYCKINTGKFYRHEEEGERIARGICKRLKISKKQTELCCNLVALHMYNVDMKAGESKVRRFIIKNYSLLPQLLKLKQADFSACKDDLSVCGCVKKWQNILQTMQKEGVPFTVKQLNVKGNELIDAGVSADKVGKVLNTLLNECATQPNLNEKNKLIKRALQTEVKLW